MRQIINAYYIDSNTLEVEIICIHKIISKQYKTFIIYTKASTQLKKTIFFFIKTVLKLYKTVLFFAKASTL